MPSWHFQSVPTGIQQYSSTRIFFDSDNPIGPVRLEFIRNMCGVKSYINTYCGLIPPYLGNPSLAWVGIGLSNQQEAVFIASRFEGGQRLLLPPEAMELILQGLREGNTLTINLISDEGTFTPKNFCRVWEHFIHVLDVS